MILTGLELRKHVENGDIEIDPFVPEHVNPVSIDLTLGSTVAVYEAATSTEVSRYFASAMGRPFDGSGLQPIIRSAHATLDSKRENRVIKFPIPEGGWVLEPGVCYLMHTVERVHTRKFVPILDGKSSLGRLFVQVHVTAGFGDPGFNGQYTLEVTSMFPVRVYAGMRFCQMRFHGFEGEVETYQGHYQAAAAEGPVASRSFESSFDG